MQLNDNSCLVLGLALTELITEWIRGDRKLVPLMKMLCEVCLFTCEKTQNHVD